MIDLSNVPAGYRCKLFRYTITPATKLGVSMVVEVEVSVYMRCMYWYIVLPKYINYLRTWIQTGIIMINTGDNPEPADNEIHCVLVGYKKGYTDNVSQ